MDPKFSMGLRSGTFPGNEPKLSMFCSLNHLSITFALRHKCAVMLEKALFFNKLLDLVPFFIHGCVRRQNCEEAHSLGEKQPHP